MDTLIFMADHVYFEWIEKNKNAKCQFPRDIRLVGCKFMAPASAIKVYAGRA